MDFYIKEAALGSLTPEVIKEFSNGKSRYNCIVDLTSKSELQLKLFIDRINDIYHQLLQVRELISSSDKQLPFSSTLQPSSFPSNLKIDAETGRFSSYVVNKSSWESDLKVVSSQQSTVNSQQPIFTTTHENQSLRVSASPRLRVYVQGSEQRRIYPYLCIAFCKSENESQENGFPLYDFLSFEVVNQMGVLSSGLGVMLSTYTHDLDREILEQKDSLQGDISLSVDLWNSLFKATTLNNGIAPLAGRYPIFVFPQQSSQIGLKSTTNDYMGELGLSMKLDYTLNGYPMRIFYKYHYDNGYTYTNEVYLAILAIGQVLLEITRPDLYPSNSRLIPFNRENFTDQVKFKQKQTFIDWLQRHNLLPKLPVICV
ncbi:MAG: hypothetical protein F6K31_24925 [Symploca sp. SIO2G7]|nr:hypothetical protein [Symploca sp. SIO2G7]